MLILDKLFEYGINESNIRHMMEINPYLEDVTDKEFDEKIEVLKGINCSHNQIIDIITSNSNVLSLSNSDLYKLIIFLKEIGINSLNILIESNPFILNLELFEIKNYLQEELKSKSIKEVVENLEDNPMLFNDM